MRGRPRRAEYPRNDREGAIETLYLGEILEQAFEAFLAHPPNSREHRAAVLDLTTAVHAVGERAEPTTLEVAGGRFRSPDRGAAGVGERPLAGALEAAGVRSLTVAPGVEVSEIVRMLMAAAVSSNADVGHPADLRTVLWGLDLEHVRYAVEAERTGAPPPARGGSRAPGGPSDVRARVQEEAAGRRPGVVDPREFDSTLYFLDAREVDYLKGEIDREYAQDLGRNLVALVLDVLEAREDPDTRREVTGVMTRLLPALLAQGSFAAATYMLEETEAVMRSFSMTAADRRTLDRMAADLSKPAALGQLLQLLEEGRGVPSAVSLGGFLCRLRPQALPILLRWSNNLTNAASSAVLAEAIDLWAEARPDALVRSLSSPERVVVLRALELVQRLRPRGCVEDLCALSSRPDPALRSALADVLGSIGGPRCCGELTRMIDDDATEVRVSALHALSTRNYPRAYGRIEEILEAESLGERDLSEQRALFEAYGSLAGNQGLALLEAFLTGKKGAARRSAEVRACAALGLGRMGTPAARLILEGAADDRNPIVRTAAARALRDEA